MTAITEARTAVRHKVRADQPSNEDTMTKEQQTTPRAGETIRRDSAELSELDLEKVSSGGGEIVISKPVDGSSPKLF